MTLERESIAVPTRQINNKLNTHTHIHTARICHQPHILNKAFPDVCP